MKKIFTLIVALAATVSMSAASYQIVFNGNGKTSDGSTVIAAKTFLTDTTVVASGAEYIESLASATRVYVGLGDKGLKFASGSGVGTMTLNLSEAGQVKATKVAVTACAWPNDFAKSKCTKIKVNGVESDSTLGDGSETMPCYEIALDGTQLTTLTIATVTSGYRAYVKSIEVMYDESTSVADATAEKEVAGVKYYNLAGVESATEFSGINIKVTTYTDGTKKAVKVIK